MLLLTCGVIVTYIRTEIGEGEEAKAVSALLSKFMEDAYARSASEVNRPYN